MVQGCKECTYVAFYVAVQDEVLSFVAASECCLCRGFGASCSYTWLCGLAIVELCYSTLTGRVHACTILTAIPFQDLKAGCRFESGHGK